MERFILNRAKEHGREGEPYQKTGVGTGGGTKCGGPITGCKSHLVGGLIDFLCVLV